VARVGKLGQHVDELRPKNVLLLEVRPAGADFEHCHRIKGDMDRAIEDAEVGLPEMRCQPFGFDQKLGMGQIFRRCCHVPAPHSASGYIARKGLIQSEKSRLSMTS
jgi:hypothetical protein